MLFDELAAADELLREEAADPRPMAKAAYFEENSSAGLGSG